MKVSKKVHILAGHSCNNCRWLINYFYREDGCSWTKDEEMFKDDRSVRLPEDKICRNWKISYNLMTDEELTTEIILKEDSLLEVL